MTRSEPVKISWGKVYDPSGLVSEKTIRQAVRQIVKHFDPDRIILFGSYARDNAGPRSDVDLFVVMNARNEINQALRIENLLDAPFSLDVIVRTPRKLTWLLKDGDWFSREVVEQGKILYEKNHKSMGAKGRTRPGRRPKAAQGSAASAR